MNHNVQPLPEGTYDRLPPHLEFHEDQGIHQWMSLNDLGFSSTNSFTETENVNTDISKLYQDDFRDQHVWPSVDWANNYEKQCTDTSFDVEVPHLSTGTFPTDIQNRAFTFGDHRPAQDGRAKSNDAPSEVTQPTHVSCAPKLYHSLSHIPTFLIEYWFRDVCKVWSGFDSHKNMNRSLVMEMFSNSEVLCNTVQSMSAAFLTDRMPQLSIHLKEATITATKNAVSAIKKDLASTSHITSFDHFPKGILLSVLCMGTSAFWTVPQQLGTPYLLETKRLLSLLNKSAGSLSIEDQRTLSFFQR